MLTQTALTKLGTVNGQLFKAGAFSFVAHRIHPADRFSAWVVTEPSTGLSVARGRNRQDSINRARMAVTEFGEQFVRDAIQKALAA